MLTIELHTSNGTSRASATVIHGAQPRLLEFDSIDIETPLEGNLLVCRNLDVPGVIGRAPGGLTYYQLVDLIKGAARRGRIEAMDFVEFMPERDVDGIGALTFARAITTALGVIARQRA